MAAAIQRQDLGLWAAKNDIVVVGGNGEDDQGYPPDGAGDKYGRA